MANKKRKSTAKDVAAYILRQASSMSAWKLQKLVYYSQVWAIVWDEEPIFRDRIEAWANGPVIPSLYREHRGLFTVVEGDIDGDPSTLADYHRETIDSVIDFYGKKSGQWLRDLTHEEPPWATARQGLDPGERGNHEITVEALAEYYGSL